MVGSLQPQNTLLRRGKETQANGVPKVLIMVVSDQKNKIVACIASALGFCTVHTYFISFTLLCMLLAGAL